MGLAGLAVVCVGAFAMSRESAASGVLKVRTGGDANTTRVVLELDSATSGKLISDGTEGDRKVVVAFPNMDVAGELAGKGQGLVKDWSVDEAGGSARLRLTLTRDAKVEKRFLLPPSDGVDIYRYVLDLKGQGAAPPPPTPAPLLPVKAVAENRASKPVIVIDAGHGGKDSGALGKTARESVITLAAAHALRERLERTGRYAVVLTRKSNVFVPLQSRVQIARAADADLFISLHADAGPKPETRGASVYTLSEKGSERVARKVMSKGGFIDMRLPGSDRSVNQILLDLTQRSTRNRSAVFAELLLEKIDGPAVLLRRSHRDAGFVVLLAPDVPAVLLEMGFMTNEEDEAALSDARRRGRLMDGVAEAIDNWFARSAPEATTVAAR
jgi:N-acetylmuramoyl-L-alanine amidase